MEDRLALEQLGGDSLQFWRCVQLRFAVCTLHGVVRHWAIYDDDALLGHASPTMVSASR
jgi:hypothetical protein